MPIPTPEARAALDQYIERLAQVADGLTVDDFRTIQINQSKRTRTRVKVWIFATSIIFMGVAYGTVFYAQILNDDSVSTIRAPNHDVSIGLVWAFSLGGLGAVASIFLHMLKIKPQETFRSSDEFEVVGRLLLGCLFSTILVMTLAPSQIGKFFEGLRTGTSVDSGVILLLPFLAGYSLPLVLGLLDKAIRAVELTIGLDDRRGIGPRRNSRS